MNKIFLLFLFLFTSNIQSQSQLEIGGIPNNTFKKKIVVKIETLGNSDLYYSGIMVFCQDTVRLIQSYTLIKVYKKNDSTWFCNNYGRFKIIVNTLENSYTVYDAPIRQDQDTIKYVLNYDNLKFKEIETKLKEKKENDIVNNKANQEREDELRQMIINDAEENRAFYENRIQGKKHNQIADFLYEEGFARSFSSGSVLKEDYTMNFRFNDLPEKVYYTLQISMWNSYGYGKLYYSIKYCYWINNHFYTSN